MADSDVRFTVSGFIARPVHDGDVHWLMHGTSMESTLSKSDWEKVLGPLSTTSRNTTMLQKLVAKLDA